MQGCRGWGMAALEVYGALSGRCLSYSRQSSVTAELCLLQCKPAGLVAAGQLASREWLLQRARAAQHVCVTGFHLVGVVSGDGRGV
jgi:hypothetical protein